jgi:hypothetical protein
MTYNLAILWIHLVLQKFCLNSVVQEGVTKLTDSESWLGSVVQETVARIIMYLAYMFSWIILLCSYCTLFGWHNLKNSSFG